jgi:hydrogenase expression/formation protein HypD
MFELRDGETARKIIQKIVDYGISATFMHVCGTHQDTLVRHGLGPLLSEANIDIRQGPGCPVCVTTPREIEEAKALAKAGKTLAIFGDMAGVPGAEGKSINDMRSEGADIRIVYGAGDAVSIAKNVDNDVVFMGVGFETTAPTTAAILLDQPPDNLSVVSCHRYVPPALKAIVESGEVKLNGLIQPGHVSTIIGTVPYRFLSENYGVPQVVAGFEPLDLLMGCLMLIQQMAEGKAEVQNEYVRVVKEEGNPKALSAMESVFNPIGVVWRGFPEIPESGMGLADAYEAHNARKLFEDELAEVQDAEYPEPKGCRCGEVLRGLITSKECPLFGNGCTPDTPIGACMVSREGSCNIDYRYG